MSSPAESFVEVPVESLLNVINPFENPPWYCKRFTVEDIWLAVEEERFQHLPVPNWYPSKDHIERIAYLVAEGWDQDKDFPNLDVGVPGFTAVSRSFLDDGNHRLCAAAARGDRTIRITISGSISYAEELLGIKIGRD